MSKTKIFDERTFRNILTGRKLTIEISGEETFMTFYENLSAEAAYGDHRKTDYEKTDEDYVDEFNFSEINQYDTFGQDYGNYATPNEFMLYISKVFESSSKNFGKIINIKFKNLNVDCFDTTVLPRNYSYRFIFTDTRHIGEIKIDYDFPLIFVSIDYFNSYFSNSQRRFYECKLFYSFCHLKYLSDFFFRGSHIYVPQLKVFGKFLSSFRGNNHLLISTSDNHNNYNRKIYNYEDFFLPLSTRDFFPKMIEDNLISDDEHKMNLECFSVLEKEKCHPLLLRDNKVFKFFKEKGIERVYFYKLCRVSRYIRDYNFDREKISKLAVVKLPF